MTISKGAEGVGDALGDAADDAVTGRPAATTVHPTATITEARATAPATQGHRVRRGDGGGGTGRGALGSGGTEDTPRACPTDTPVATTDRLHPTRGDDPLKEPARTFLPR